MPSRSFPTLCSLLPRIWFSTVPFYFTQTRGVTFFLASSRRSQTLVFPIQWGRGTLSKTNRSDKTLRRSQGMCERNAQTHAETIWKPGWNEQLSILCAQKSLKTCGQRSDRQCPAQSTGSTGEHEISVPFTKFSRILASLLDSSAGASWVPDEQITYLWKPESFVFRRACLASAFTLWVVHRALPGK